MSSEALELALALYRAPAQRFVLRDRALPPDIGEVIRLASGNPELLRHASEVLCEPESVVLEAVRFYLQQVLFDEDADAYRVLGLDASAPQERIREHYQWLQRWVHPDRRGEDWVALYSTRVNGAWNQLRNKASREAYDLAQTPAEPNTNLVHHSVGGVWMPIPVELPQRNWLRFAVLGGSLTTCAVLLVAALMREDPAPADWATAGRSRVATVVRTTPKSSLTKPTPNASQYAVKPTHDSMSRLTSAPIRKPSEAVTQPAPWSMARLPIPVSPTAQSDATLAASPATTAVSLDGRNQLARRGRQTGLPAPASNNTNQRSGGQSLVNLAAAQSPSPNAGLPSNVDTTPGKQSARQIAVGAIQPASRSARHGTPPTLPDIPKIVAVKPPVSINLDASNQLSASATTTPVDMVARIDLARQRVRELTAYFDGSNANLTASWLDAAVQVTTERLRSSLYTRTQRQGFGAFSLESPRWHLSDDQAGLSANYRVRRDGNPFESGKFFVDMAWRGDTWHVTRVALEPTQ